MKTNTIVIKLTILCFAFSAEAESLSQIRLPGKYTLNTNVSIQARIEYGDLSFGETYTTRGSEFDVYFRRLRFGVDGIAYSQEIGYGFTFSADESAQSEIFPAYSEADGVLLSDAYISYKLSENSSIRFVKGKLPYSRIYLTSSSRQLFAERPYYSYALTSFFRSYVNTHVEVSGKLLEGQINYQASISKAWRPTDALYSDNNITVDSASPHMVTRVEWSPEELIESNRSDSHIGVGRHLTLGAYTAVQNNIVYAEVSGARENRLIYGVDLSFHFYQFTFQTEYNNWEINSTDNNYDKNSDGYYLQFAYLLNPTMWEPALRYERLTLDKDIDGSQAKTITLGLNKYIYHHKLKYSINWEYSSFDKYFDFLRAGNETHKNTFRLTLQLIM